MKRTKAQEAERQEAIERLREWIKPGDTVYTVLDHVSRSGMSRNIRVVLLKTNPDTGEVVTLHPNHAVALAIGAKQAKHGDGLTIGGCGMDMGFHLVNSLSAVLYGARLRRDVYKDDATTINRDGTGPLLSREGAPEGFVYVGGYRCLGKGKCPSNYHVNHRDRIRCEGAGGAFCWRPDTWSSRFPVPDNWPRGEAIDIGDGATLPGPPLSCLTGSDDNGATPTVCPTCKGEGSLPNPDGPERFDLIHRDGYAINHRWL